jgi:hypothetical protein
MYSTTVEEQNFNYKHFLENGQRNLEQKRVFKTKARPSKSLGFVGMPYSQTQCKKEFESYSSNVKWQSEDVKRKRAISLVEQRSSFRISGKATFLESPSVVQAVLATRPGTILTNFS